MNELFKIPVPREIPLPLPLPYGVLVVLLIFSFLLHILFINLMLGGSVLTLWYEIKGLRKKGYDMLALEIAKTITVNKSIAIVLGVAPLLSINVLYTVYFYSANTLTGLMWISVIPWVAVSFILLYTHKYTWHKLENNKPLHIFLLIIAVASFLFIPLIFLANINLMLFPEKWGTIKGFFSALTLPNVFPRYFHFITASLAVTGLFLFGYFGQKKYRFEEKFSDLTRYEVRKKAYSLTLGASIIQLIFGPIVYLTLPTKGMSWNLFYFISAGVIVAVFAIYIMWKEVTGPEEKIGRRFGLVVTALAITIVMMATGRHIYRATALAPHQKLMAERTARHLELVEKIRSGEITITSEEPEISAGHRLFKENCTVCHRFDTRLVGPPVKEMIGIYKDNIPGFKAWVRKPGKKRSDYPAMTGFPGLSDEQLTQLAHYIYSELAVKD